MSEYQTRKDIFELQLRVETLEKQTADPSLFIEETIVEAKKEFSKIKEYEVNDFIASITGGQLGTLAETKSFKFNDVLVKNENSREFWRYSDVTFTLNRIFDSDGNPVVFAVFSADLSSITAGSNAPYIKVIFVNSDKAPIAKEFNISFQQTISCSDRNKRVTYSTIYDNIPKFPSGIYDIVDSLRLIFGAETAFRC
jgi:hypothetical protein